MATTDSEGASMQLSSQSVPYVPSTTFSSLPLELRQEIWLLTLEPRTVEIDYLPYRGFVSRESLPAALSICRESRAFTLKLYPLCFGSFVHPSRLRVNFELDTIYLDWELRHNLTHFFSTMQDADIKGLKYLAIDVQLMDEGTWEYNNELDGQCLWSIVSATKRLPALKELMCVFQFDWLTNYKIRRLDWGGDWAGPTDPPIAELEQWQKELDKFDRSAPFKALCSGRSPMVLYKELPAALKGVPWLRLCPLPEPDDVTELGGWSPDNKLKIVHGWRPTPVRGFEPFEVQYEWQAEVLES